MPGYKLKVENNKKTQILKAFQTMDIDSLSVLLDNNKTYQCATKAVFIQKIKTIFSQFKSLGDTFLIIRAGACVDCNCPNFNSSGYSFIGDNSGNYLDLIFDESGEDVRDIYQCSYFENYIDTSEKNESFYIEIMEDEKADFRPTYAHWIKSQKCRIACDELMKHEAHGLDKTIYLPWLDQYRDLYNSFRGNIYSICHTDFFKFYRIYTILSEAYQYIKNEPVASEALDEYKSIDSNSDGSLLIWLFKYEDLREELSAFLIDCHEPETPEPQASSDPSGIKINANQFAKLELFKNTFDELSLRMGDKYPGAAWEEE